MINFPHQLISNFNLHSINIKIYFDPKYSENDPSGTAIFFRQIQDAMDKYIRVPPGPQDVPNIVNDLSKFDNITKAEIINPMNLNGYYVEFKS